MHCSRWQSKCWICAIGWGEVCDGATPLSLLTTIEAAAHVGGTFLLLCQVVLLEFALGSDADATGPVCHPLTRSNQALICALMHSEF